ncbi:structure-specific endonuclease subunit slx1 [Impatiens glandulifera]|uniref:structure-specific endonuclease subunit slx1 n=1 Tax=Impatiens glandulifera TaxID=253017 RepID=UPI001FB07163|nr:structure-specific endonuclease subunit slx1 [Impatiens glandulifera]
MATTPGALLSRTFRSLKPSNSGVFLRSKPPVSSLPMSSPPSSVSVSPNSSKKKPKPKPKPFWSVYLILSTNLPIKTYVGVTTNSSRRLKEHNGELRGGAKTSYAGRPWVFACIIQGFINRSEACSFESKWKSWSKKVTRKRSNANDTKQPTDPSRLLLQHRLAALGRVQDIIDCSHLEIDWRLDPS